MTSCDLDGLNYKLWYNRCMIFDSDRSKLDTLPELSFAHLAPDIWDTLGKIPRTGWMVPGMPQEKCETVQGHSLALREMMWMFDGLDDFTKKEKCEMLDIFEIHDWPEAIHGDQITATIKDPVVREKVKKNKFEREKAALEMICSEMESEGERVMDLWLRFETEEKGDRVARFARELDTYQRIELSLYYELEYGIGGMFEEFCGNGLRRINNPFLVSKIKELKQMHQTVQDLCSCDDESCCSKQ